MGAKLTQNVWVQDAKGEPFLLAVGTEVPEWAAALVTNQKAFAGGESESEGEGGSDDDSHEPGEYDTWKNDDLKAALKERELPVSGNHDELVARLREADAEKAKESESEGEGGSDDDSDLGDPGDDENKE